MSFAENKVKEHIDNNLKKFQNRVRVTHLLHLRCFTDVDRQEISAFERHHGNNLAFWEFFQRLHVRQGWVQLFIEALQADHVGDLAEELQEVYSRHQLPPPRRNTSSPAATAEAAQLPGTRTTSCSPPPPAEMELSPRQSPPLSSAAQPPCPFHADAPRPAASTAIPVLPDEGDCSTPVQETKVPSQSSERTVRPEAMRNEGKAEPSTLPEEATASPSKVGGQKLTGGQATSSTRASPGPPEQPVEVSFSSTPVVSLRPGAGSLTHRWDQGQQHAAHERRGFSGNGNRVKGNGLSPSSAAPPNQPEENYYYSADNSPCASGGPEEQPGKEWLKERKVQAPPGNQNGQWSDYPLGAGASPSQWQRQFGGGQGNALGSRGSCETVGMEDVGEMPSVDPVAEEPGNLQPRGNRVALQVLAAAPVLQALAFGRESYTSTEVIPPNSPLGPSDFASEVTKLPIQEKKLSSGEPSVMHATLPTREEVPSATVDWSTVNIRRNRNDRIFHTNCDESLCKPEILMSHPDDPPMGLPGQQPSGQEGMPEYSGRTDRFRCSDDTFSLGSDSLQRSDSSRPGVSGGRCPNPEGSSVPGRNVGTTVARDASDQPLVGIQQENGSIRTFVHSVRQEVSVDVTGAPDAMDFVGDSGPPSPDVPPDSASGLPPVSGANAHGDGTQPKGPAGAKPSSTPSSDTLLLAGAAALVFAAVAFFLLQKRK